MQKTQALDFTDLPLKELSNIERLVVNGKKNDLIGKKRGYLRTLFTSKNEKNALCDYTNNIMTHYGTGRPLGLYLEFLDIEQAKKLHPEYTVSEIQTHIERERTEYKHFMALKHGRKIAPEYKPTLSDEVGEQFREHQKVAAGYARDGNGMTIRNHNGEHDPTPCRKSGRIDSDEHVDEEKAARAHY